MSSASLLGGPLHILVGKLQQDLSTKLYMCGNYFEFQTYSVLSNDPKSLLHRSNLTKVSALNL